MPRPVGTFSKLAGASLARTLRASRRLALVGCRRQCRLGRQPMPKECRPPEKPNRPTAAAATEAPMI
jgi:hypothetical protein